MSAFQINAPRNYCFSCTFSTKHFIIGDLIVEITSFQSNINFYRRKRSDKQEKQYLSTLMKRVSKIYILLTIPCRVQQFRIWFGIFRNYFFALFADSLELVYSEKNVIACTKDLTPAPLLLVPLEYMYIHCMCNCILCTKSLTYMYVVLATFRHSTRSICCSPFCPWHKRRCC